MQVVTVLMVSKLNQSDSSCMRMGVYSVLWGKAFDDDDTDGGGRTRGVGELERSSANMTNPTDSRLVLFLDHMQE